MSIESVFKVAGGLFLLTVASVGCYKSYQSYREEKEKSERSIRKSEEEMEESRARTERAHAVHLRRMAEIDRLRAEDKARHEALMEELKADAAKADRYAAFYSVLIDDLIARKITPDEMVAKIKAFK